MLTTLATSHVHGMVTHPSLNNSGMATKSDVGFLPVLTMMLGTVICTFITEKLTWYHEGIHALLAPSSLFIVDGWTLTSKVYNTCSAIIRNRLVTGQLGRLHL